MSMFEKMDLYKVGDWVRLIDQRRTFRGYISRKLGGTIELYDTDKKQEYEFDLMYLVARGNIMNVTDAEIIKDEAYYDNMIDIALLTRDEELFNEMVSERKRSPQIKKIYY